MSTNSTYAVHGMTCGSCATKDTSAVDQVAGVTGTDVDVDVDVGVTTGTLTVAGQDVDDTAAHTAITDSGYRLG